MPRHNSANAHNAYYQPGYINHVNDQLPTPPYSPRYSPEGTPTPSLSRRTSANFRSPMGTLEEAPETGRTLEELRTALRNGLGSENSGTLPIDQVLSVLIQISS